MDFLIGVASVRQTLSVLPIISKCYRILSSGGLAEQSRHYRCFCIRADSDRFDFIDCSMEDDTVSEICAVCCVYAARIILCRHRLDLGVYLSSADGRSECDIGTIRIEH